MLIESMTRQASLALLDRTRLARLGCAHDGQPYIVPMTVRLRRRLSLQLFHLGPEDLLDARQSPGLRRSGRAGDDAAMGNRHRSWAGTKSFRIRPNMRAARAHAHALLQRRPGWWEPGYVKTIVDGKERPLGSPVFSHPHRPDAAAAAGLPG